MNFSKWVRGKVDEEIAKEGMVVKNFTLSAWLADERDIPEEVEGVKLKETDKAILVDLLNLPEKMWFPKSQVEKAETIAPYEEEAEYP